MKRSFLVIMLILLTIFDATVLSISNVNAPEKNMSIHEDKVIVFNGYAQGKSKGKSFKIPQKLGAMGITSEGVFAGMYYRITTPDREVPDPSSGTAVYGKALLLNRYTDNSSLRHSIPVPGITVSAYDMNSGQPYDAGYISPPDGSANGANYKGYGTTGNDGYFWFSFIVFRKINAK